MLTDRQKKALKAAFTRKGTGLAKLKKNCPRINTDAAAAWQAMVWVYSPQRISVGHHLLMEDDIRVNVYEPIVNALKLQKDELDK